MRARSAVDMPKYCATEPSESPARTVYRKNLCDLAGFASEIDAVAGDAVAGDAYDQGEAARTLPGGSCAPYPWRAAPADDGADASCAMAGIAVVTAAVRIRPRIRTTRCNEDFIGCIEKTARTGIGGESSPDIKVVDSRARVNAIRSYRRGF